MNKILIAAVVSMALAGCGGGDSDTDTAAEPPAPDMPPADDGSPQPVPLAMSCSKQPSGDVITVADATATFTVNQPINTKGVLATSCQGGSLFAEKSVDVISGQASVKQPVPSGCRGFTLHMTLTLNDENLSATCS